MATEVVVTETPAPEPAAEVVPPVVVEAVESASEAAVTIAAIEADRDVEIAAMRDATEREALRLSYDSQIASLREELEQCRTTILSLNQQNTELKEALSSIPPPSTPADTSDPTNPSEGGGNEPTQVNPEGQEAPTPEPVRKRAKFRWI